MTSRNPGSTRGAVAALALCLVLRPGTALWQGLKGVDAKAGAIKIRHGPIAALKWPAMTMDFKASPQVLATARTGKTVTFTLDAAGEEVVALQ